MSRPGGQRGLVTVELAVGIVTATLLTACLVSLTMLGVTRPVTLSINRFRCAPHPLNKRETCGADVVATLKRSEFGMTKYIPSVGDDVRLLIAVEAFRE